MQKHPEILDKSISGCLFLYVKVTKIKKSNSTDLNSSKREEGCKRNERSLKNRTRKANSSMSQ